MKYYIFAILILSACSQPTDKISESEKLMQTSRDWAKVAATGDVEKVLNYWTDDAIVISSGQPVLKGKQAIRGMVEGSFKTPGFQITWEPESAEISKDGDMGYLIEHDDMTMNDSTGKPIKLRYKSVTIWKKQSDGSWKNVVDVMSPEQK